MSHRKRWNAAIHKGLLGGEIPPSLAALARVLPLSAPDVESEGAERPSNDLRSAVVTFRPAISCRYETIPMSRAVPCSG